MRRFEYLIPESAEQAAELCAEGSTRAKAGGVDLLDLMKEGLERPARVVGLQRALADQDLAWLDGGELRLSAGLTLSQVARLVAESHPALAEAAGTAATPQVREMATLGGNLLQRPRCWYFRSRHYACLKKGGAVCYAQDGLHETHALFDNGGCAVVHASNVAPALIAHDARLLLTGPQGARELPLETFYLPASADPQAESILQPGEILTHVVLAAASRGPRSAHYEVRQKQSYDWPLAMAAVDLNGPAPRLVLGAVASTPIHLHELAEPLRAWATAPAPDQLEAIADRAVSQATPLNGNAWRLPLARSAVKRALLKAAGIPEEQW